MFTSKWNRSPIKNYCDRSSTSQLPFEAGIDKVFKWKRVCNSLKGLAPFRSQSPIMSKKASGKKHPPTSMFTSSVTPFLRTLEAVGRRLQKSGIFRQRRRKKGITRFRDLSVSFNENKSSIVRGRRKPRMMRLQWWRLAIIVRQVSSKTREGNVSLKLIFNIELELQRGIEGPSPLSKKVDKRVKRANLYSDTQRPTEDVWIWWTPSKCSVMKLLRILMSEVWHSFNLNLGRTQQVSLSDGSRPELNRFQRHVISTAAAHRAYRPRLTPKFVSLVFNRSFLQCSASSFLKCFICTRAHAKISDLQKYVIPDAKY